MNTKQVSQSRAIEAIFDIPIVSWEIHGKLFFDLGGEMVVFPPLLGPEAKIPK